MNFQFSRSSLFPQKTLMGSRIQKKPSESQPTAQSTDTYRWQKTAVVYKLLGFIGCNFPFLPLSLSAQYQSVLTLAKIYSSVPKEGQAYFPTLAYGKNQSKVNSQVSQWVPMLGTPTLSIEITVATFLIVRFWISYSKMAIFIV